MNLKFILLFLFYFLLISGFGQGTRKSDNSQRGVVHFRAKHSYDVQKYTLNLDIFRSFSLPYPKDFAASEVITFKVESELNSIRLNAANGSLQMDAVKLSGASFKHFSDTLIIYLNRDYKPGEIVDVSISYHHKNVNDSVFFASDGFVFTDNPPEGARKWFPCYDHPSDKALTDITIEVPISARLGSNGLLSDSTISGDTLTYHWKSGNPVATYLITLSSKTNYLIDQFYWHDIKNHSDSLPVLLYYKPGENIEQAGRWIVQLTDFYSKKFGDYPFEKIGFATLNGLFPWGGMENQSMINLMQGGYSNEGLIAHEHSHHWFGDLITCGTWADIWLNEGFATFCQRLWIESGSGYELYKKEMNSIADNYLSQNPGWPVYNADWAIHTPPVGKLYNTPVIYNKAACVLFQLRYVLGDSLFFEVMYRYSTDPSLMFKNAVTEDFIRVVNSVSHRDMNWFFDEWIFQPDHPEYKNRYLIDCIGKSIWNVSLTIEQVQTKTVFFRMPVEVKILFDNGKDTTLTILNDSNPQLMNWKFSRKPVSLLFDPERKILLKQAVTISRKK